MKPFTKLTAVAAPLDLANVDTDKIIPARYLRKPREAGYDSCLFYDMRFDAEGRERPDFVLNQPAYRKAAILVAGANFGCGSWSARAGTELKHITFQPGRVEVLSQLHRLRTRGTSRSQLAQQVQLLHRQELRISNRHGA